MKILPLQKFNTSLIILMFFAVGTFAKSIKVNSVEGFEKAQANVFPGDTIMWSIGDYKNMNLVLTENNIVFMSEKAGATTFSGSSSLIVAGSGITVSGFQFIGGKIKGDVIDISGSNNTVQHVNVQSYDSHYYLRIRPNCQHNIILNCNFESKPETQESSVVQVEATEGLIGYHVISRCSFKNHTAPPGAGGDFGIEALRIGYSYQRTFISRTIVEYCYFEKCNGDYEIISCKAHENLMRYNTFSNNGPAHLTLRHGSRNMVYGNFFMDGTGVRIKEGQNHSVINNYFDTGEQMALQIQNHHFDPIDTVYISNNTFVSCSPLQLGGKGDYPPRNVSFENNIFSSVVDPIFTDPTNTETWKANIYNGEKELIADGFSLVSFKMNKNEYGFSEVKFPDKIYVDFIHKELSVFDIPVLDDDPLVMLDIMKQKRTGKFNTTPGCYLPSGKTPLKCYASADNTGPIYLH